MPLPFEIGHKFQDTADPSMSAEVIAIWNEGRDAKLKFLTHGNATFELNVGAVMAGHQHWRLVP
jgi:hypothetical protein